jgi:hypothetical protein
MWSLLVCHGNNHSKILGLDPEKTITIDNNPETDPDMVLDISTQRVRGCHLFDRIYILYCPLVGARAKLVSIIHNFITPSIKQGGLVFIPDYENHTKQIMEEHGYKILDYNLELAIPEREPRGPKRAIDILKNLVAFRKL